MFRRRTALVAAVAVVCSFGAFFAGTGPASATGIPPTSGSQSCTSLVGVTKFHPHLYGGPSSLNANHKGWKFTATGLLSGCSNSTTFPTSDVIVMGKFSLSGYSTGQQNCSAPQTLHVSGKVLWTAWDPTTNTIVTNTSVFAMQSPAGQAFNGNGSTTGSMAVSAGWFTTVTINADWTSPAAVAASCAALTPPGGLGVVPITTATAAGFGPPSLSA